MKRLIDEAYRLLANCQHVVRKKTGVFEVRRDDHRVLLRFEPQSQLSVGQLITSLRFSGEIDGRVVFSCRYLDDCVDDAAKLWQHFEHLSVEDEGYQREIALSNWNQLTK
jgi:hypothetical protein